MFWFNLYSWVTGIGWLLMDIFPPFLRKIIFLAILKKQADSKKANYTIDYRTYIRYPSHVSVGESTTINRGCRLFASHYYKNVEIKIGKHVAIGPECCFFAAGHDYTQLSLPDTAASISVGDYVWIGAKSIILQGVTIGEGAIIGAGSLVTKDIPPWSVAMGSPARVVKKRDISEQDEKCL